MKLICQTRTCLFVAIVIVSLLAGNGRGLAQDANASGDCKVVFGMNTEISGAYQVYTGPAIQGLQTAADAINKSGGIKVGSKSCKFATAPFDNKSDPSQVFTASQQVTNAGDER